jgi:shikimate dehydrogenase
VRAAVLGSPIAHSLSPRLHRAAYAALGLSDWSYDALEMTPSSLAEFLDGLGPEWVGLSLTMPLKQEVLPLLSSSSPLVGLTGAANTVVLSGGQRVGHNTDVHGIVAALQQAGVSRISRAAVIGAGATAASALAALHELGAHHVRVLARSIARARSLEPVAAALGVELRFGELHPLEVEDRWPEVVVNTTPAGALEEFAALSDPSGDVPVLLDVVYAPWPTPLAAVYSSAGGVVVGGAEMLLHQAAAQVELMTERDAPLAAMRAVLYGE